MANATRTHNLDGPGALRALENAMDRALQGGGLILKQEMQRLAPELTGRMLRSVRVTPTEKEPNGFSVRVGPTVDYAKYTEEEPWTVGKRPGPKSQIKGVSIPWMKPAAQNKRDEITNFIQTGIRTTIRGLARR